MIRNPNFRAMLAVVRKIVVVLVALVVGLNVIRWTGETFREYAVLFLSLMVMMVLVTGALARSVGKLPYCGKVKAIWLALICYLSLVSLANWDFVRNELGKRYVPGYNSYYDCEDATPDNPCFFSTYRVNGHISATIEGLSLLYIVVCIACPWAAYRLWRNSQTNIETLSNDAQNAIKVARLRTAADQGDAEAQDSLGFFYCIGAGVPLDYVQAATWFRKAAEQGNAEAQYHLGLAYYKGEGVPKDYAQAAFWWRKAAEQGEETAQYNLKNLLH
jgi:TPR repeat protein